MEKWRPLIITVIGVSLSSLIHLSILEDGFIIAMSPLFLVVFLYLYPELPPVRTGLIAGGASTLFRALVQSYSEGSVAASLAKCWPDIIFFYTFILLYYLLKVNSLGKQSQYTRFFVCVFFCDMLANFTEMSFRLRAFPGDWDFIQSIILFAALRTLGSLIVIFSINRYNYFLAREQHEERYQKLLLMAAALNTEVYFMNKNMVEVEDVMKKAFTLYRKLEQEQQPSELQSISLDIAKDVHEIKKDYVRVIQGLQEGFFDDVQSSGMEIKDLIRILQNDIQEQIRKRELDIYFSTRVKAQFHVEQHFSLMSVLRNLVVNSIDALSKQEKGLIELNVEEKSAHYRIEISDNGPGIKPDELELIYEPGFSTKFNQTTGDIYRGVGLTLVKDLLQDKFQGRIETASQPGRTTFEILIPKTVFTGEEIA